MKITKIVPIIVAVVLVIFVGVQFAISTTGHANLTINSNPCSADIFIDNEYVGSTPFSGGVKTGEHKIDIKLEGYEEYSETINFEDQETITINPELKPLKKGLVKILNATTVGEATFDNANEDIIVYTEAPQSDKIYCYDLKNNTRTVVFENPRNISDPFITKLRSTHNHKIIFEVHNGDASQPGDIYQVDLDSGRPFNLTNSGKVIMSDASDVANYIAYINSDNKLYLMNLLNYKSKLVSKQPVTSFSISPDGLKLAYIVQDKEAKQKEFDLSLQGELFVVDCENLSEINKQHFIGFESMKWSPDSSSLVITGKKETNNKGSLNFILDLKKKEMSIANSTSDIMKNSKTGKYLIKIKNRKLFLTKDSVQYEVLDNAEDFLMSPSGGRALITAKGDSELWLLDCNEYLQ